jgi:hypothetical protein
MWRYHALRAHNSLLYIQMTLVDRLRWLNPDKSCKSIKRWGRDMNNRMASPNNKIGEASHVVQISNRKSVRKNLIDKLLHDKTTGQIIAYLVIVTLFVLCTVTAIVLKVSSMTEKTGKSR